MEDDGVHLRQASIKNRRKDTTTMLEKLFQQPDISFEEELDRLNHDEILTTYEPNGSSTPILEDKGEETASYFYQPTVHTGRFHQEMKSTKISPSGLFRSKAKQNLRNLFEAGRNADSIKRTNLNPKSLTKDGSQKGVFSNLIYDFTSLAILGIAMAIISLLMDLAIEKLGDLHVLWLDSITAISTGVWRIILTYSVWVFFAVSLTSGCSIFVHFVSPQAIGSGIPEMKTILRGVILKEYLSFRTMISKIVGLTLSLGSGMPIGKEGPFVHVSSILANLLSKFLNTFDSVYINESRRSEMLAVGCAVGVSCVFSSPVGGVLFSIEATSFYFHVRNYWRGFFASACSATTFRLLRVFMNKEITVTAYFQTNFPKEAFFPEELPIFALIGLICGIASAGFIVLHRKMVLFLRANTLMKKIFQKHWYIYPIVISFFISSITYPKGMGQLLSGERKFGQAARDMFLNCSWSAPNGSALYCKNQTFLGNWTGESGSFSIFLTLSCFIAFYFFMVALALTLPIPSGAFGPSFTLGAAFGRLCGELMYLIFPNGVQIEREESLIYPGVYAVVGAAAFTGGLTHTISVSVIVFELTGQLVALLPVMIAVLIANAVCSYLQPSLYDSIIRIKHLPFLPDIRHSSSNFHGIKVEDFMISEVIFITPQTTYGELQKFLMMEPHLKAIPVVENNNSMILLGSSSRKRLIESLDKKVGVRARQAEAFTRIKKTFDEMGRHLKPSNNNKINLDVESQSNLPDKMQFYYTDRPNLPDSKSTNETDELGKFSRFTVTNVPEVAIQEPSPPASRSQSRKNSLSSENNSINSKKSDRQHKTITNRALHGLADAITHLGSVRHNNRKNGDREIDLYGEERKQWERQQLGEMIKLSEIGVDSAPFQLTSNTSLLKVHSLFSLIGLNRAYVTKYGRLVGVVALRDIRTAIELAQQNKISTVNDNEELQMRRKMQSMSVKEKEDVRNDRLNPPLQHLSRASTTLSIHDLERSFASLPETHLSAPHFLNPSEKENPIQRPWKSVCNPMPESNQRNESPPIISITPPDEAETDSVKSSKFDDNP